MTDRILEIGGEPFATIEFLNAREKQTGQIIINTCCDSVSIFDEQTAEQLIAYTQLWLTRFRQERARQLDALDKLPPAP